MFGRVLTNLLIHSLFQPYPDRNDRMSHLVVHVKRDKVIVPQKRTEVAKSKRDGEIKEYITELREAEVEKKRKFERWLVDDYIQQDKNQKVKRG